MKILNKGVPVFKMTEITEKKVQFRCQAVDLAGSSIGHQNAKKEKNGYNYKKAIKIMRLKSRCRSKPRDQL